MCHKQKQMENPINQAPLSQFFVSTSLRDGTGCVCVCVLGQHSMTIELLAVLRPVCIN